MFRGGVKKVAICPIISETRPFISPSIPHNPLIIKNGKSRIYIKYITVHFYSASKKHK